MANRTCKNLTAIALACATQVTLATQFGCPAGAPEQQLAETTNTSWLNAVASGNPQRLASLYAENAVLMPPTDETIVGREPIGRYLSGTNTMPGLRDYTVDIVGCDLNGDTLEIAGVWGAEQQDFRGESHNVTGNVVRIANRQADGSWSLKYEIWN